MYKILLNNNDTREIICQGALSARVLQRKKGYDQVLFFKNRAITNAFSECLCKKGPCCITTLRKIIIICTTAVFVIKGFGYCAHVKKEE
jgi:hypothetical protein